MQINKKKIIEMLIILIVIIVFIIMGIIIYERYKVKEETKEEVVTIDNYYNSEFLFNNGYIEKAREITDLKDENISIYLDKDNNLYIKKVQTENNFNKQITGLPKGKINVYYNNLNNNCYEFAALEGETLYYTNMCLDNDKEYIFEKISTLAKEIYVPVTKNNNLYITETNEITSNFIINTENNEMKYISIEDNIPGLYNDLENIKPYFDYICVLNKEICKNTMYYLNFEKELVINYDLENSIKLNNNEKLIVQDLFGTFKINSLEKIDLNNLTYEELLNQKDFLFKLYVLDINNNLYTIDMTNNTLKNKEKPVLIKNSEEKVKTITYEKNELSEITGLIITYENGKYEEITKDINYEIITSTLYEKNNNKNLLDSQ